MAAAPSHTPASRARGFQFLHVPPQPSLFSVYVAILMRVSGQLTVVWICSSLKVSHLLIDSLCIFVGEMSIQVPLTIRQSGRCFFLLLSCSSLDIPDSNPLSDM